MPPKKEDKILYSSSSPLESEDSKDAGSTNTGSNVNSRDDYDEKINELFAKLDDQSGKIDRQNEKVSQNESLVFLGFIVIVIMVS